jgi:hypothetical protein
MTILNDYSCFSGLHWATGYLHNTLTYQGVVAPHTGQPYSEAMLMGINGGLCAGYFAFDYKGYDPHVHFLTRYLFDETPGAVFERLGIPMNTQQTTDPQKAIANVINGLAKVKPVVVWADVMSLYDSSSPPLADMWLVMPVLVYGYDMKKGVVHIADRAKVPLTTSAANFEAARARIKKHRNRIMTIDAPDPAKLPDAVRAGIRACIDIFVAEPPVGSKSSFGFDAYQKWARLLATSKDKQSWSKMFAPGRKMYNGLTTAYQSLELWFTGGNGSRGVYADFLDEATVVLDNTQLKEAATQFRTCAEHWGTFAKALLPDHVQPFKETRELMRRSYDLFLTKGNASVDERRQINARLDALKLEIEKDFPLSDAQVTAFRAELREHLLRIHDAERVAIDLLNCAVS